MSRTSMLPPTRRGGTMLCLPGAAGATPMVPVKGFKGTLAQRPNSAGASVPGSYFHRCSAAALNSSASRPIPGMFAVHPQPEGSKPRSVTLSTSPGRAPSMKIGPHTGLIRPKSMRPTSPTVEAEDSCPPAASSTSNSKISPGAMRAAGSRLLSQPRCDWWMVREWLMTQLYRGWKVAEYARIHQGHGDFMSLEEFGYRQELRRALTTKDLLIYGMVFMV